MAGGIDWFRWHHGSVNDQKFRLVARRSKQTLPTVIAVWAFVLEQASASDERGHFGAIDVLSVDCAFDLEDGATAAILEAMQERGLIADGAVCAWSKRQRERVQQAAPYVAAKSGGNPIDIFPIDEEVSRALPTA